MRAAKHPIETAMSPEVINGLFALGGAVVGAVLTGAISWLQAAKHRKLSRLSVFTTRPSRLVEVHSTISKDVTITIAGESVPTVYTIEMTVANSGTEPLHNVEVVTEFDGNGKVLTANLGETNFEFEPNDVVVAPANNSQVDLSTSYLNPGDEFVVKMLLSDRPTAITPKFRQPGVKFVSRTGYDSPVSNALSEALFEAISSNTLLRVYMTFAIPSFRRYLEDREDADKPSSE